MESYCSLCTLDTIPRLFFVTRLMINKINKVQWVDFIRNGELLGHSPIHHSLPDDVSGCRDPLFLSQLRILS
jgi:hypothetical protein